MGEGGGAWTETIDSKVSTYSVNHVKPKLPLKIHQEGTKQIITSAQPVFSPAYEQNFFGCARQVAGLYLEVLYKSTYF